MAIRIGHAPKDERGKFTGGTAGDQTGMDAAHAAAEEIRAAAGSSGGADGRFRGLLLEFRDFLYVFGYAILKFGNLLGVPGVLLRQFVDGIQLLLDFVGNTEADCPGFFQQFIGFGHIRDAGSLARNLRFDIDGAEFGLHRFLFLR